MPADRAAIRAAARENLGHRTLLPGQAEAVAAITGGRDTLALLPTGGGKSAVYQLAGVMLDGPSVVVSPLIALQHDQAARLAELELGVAVLNSTRPGSERQETLAAFGQGEIEFLMVGPETLADAGVLAEVAAARPSLFVVDEAHCVAEWGPDFRPDYRRLGAIADAVGRPPILALTATASPMVRAEIVERLGLRDPAIVARGFDRPNIDLVVTTHADERSKRDALVEAVVDAPKPGIVYVATRAAADELAARLAEADVPAEAYHAGLPSRRRQAVQDRFKSRDDGVIVATIAFGMGIDKPNVRFVYHLDAPETLDAYHQEIGRAGRDAAPAQAHLYYRPEDLGLRRFQAALPRLDEATVRAVSRVLRRAGPLTVEEIARQAKRSVRRTGAAVFRLEELGAAAVTAEGLVAGRDPAAASEASPLTADIAASAVAAQERLRLVEQSRVEMVRAYAESPGCRREVLLGYFGEPFQPPCGNCDRCRAEGASLATAAERTTEAPGGGDTQSTFIVGARVRHTRFGVGTVAGVEPDRVTVAFEAVGYRTIALAAADEGLLVPEAEA